MKRPPIADSTHEHDLGFAHDMQMVMARRRALGWIMTAGGVLISAACAGDSAAPSNAAQAAASGSGSSGSGGTSSSGSCVAYPGETRGPYPADGSNSANGSVSNVLSQTGIVRSDMRGDLDGTGADAEGVRVDLTVSVVDAGSACAPLSGYAVYLWHCDAAGDYSIYNLPSRTYLRALQAVDSNGQATFTTVFPGCYSGRYPHIHLEVFQSLASATSYSQAVLTSQIAMPELESQAVYDSSSIFSASAANFANVSLSNDGIFRDNTVEEVEAQTPVLSGDPASGYTGEVTIGL